jgi:hypothetical protein
MKCLEKLEAPKKTVREEELFRPVKKQVARVESSSESSSSEEWAKSELYSESKLQEQTEQSNSLLFASASNFIRYLPSQRDEQSSVLMSYPGQNAYY